MDFRDKEDATVRTSQYDTNKHATWICPQCGLKVSASTTSCPQDGTRIESAVATPGDSVLASRYEFIEAVGTGGMSVIYKARNVAINKIVAIKMLHSHIVDDQAILRFQQEAKAATSLQHPNVIAVHDFGLSEHGQPYMVMDYIDGPTLTELIKSRGALTVPEAFDILLQVSKALEHAHTHGVLHRDLKPSNIMLVPHLNGYEARLVDFGIAKITDSGDSIAHQLTRTGEFFGSPPYMSPEQCMSKTVDQRSDIYSLGCIAYEMLVGHPPHRGDTMIETIFKHLNDIPQPLREARPQVVFPQAVEDLIMKMLANKPENRFQSMSEVVAELSDIEAGALAGREVATDKVTWEFKPSKPLMFCIAGGAMGLVGAILVLASFANLNEARELRKEQQHAQAVLPMVSNANRELTGALYKAAIEYYPKDKLNDMNLAHALSYVSDLTSLSLSSSNISDKIVPSLARLPLQSLNLSRTHITDLAMQYLPSIKTLKTLGLHGVILSPAALSEVKKIRGLKEITLSRTNTNDDVIAAICTLPLIEDLDLSDTFITDKGMSELAKVSSLRELEIDGTKVGDDGLAALKGTNHIHKLNLADTAVTGAGLRNLAGMTSLYNLSLRRLPILDNDLGFLATLPNLGFVNLSLTHVRGPGLKNLEKLEHLNVLDVTGIPLTSEGTKAIAQLNHLDSLNLGHTNIGDDELKAVCRQKKLRFIAVDSTRVTDASIDALAQQSELGELNISATSISSDGLRKLSRLEKLGKVSVWDCPNISRQAIAEFKRKRHTHFEGAGD